MRRLLPILFLSITAMALAACSGQGDSAGSGGDASETGAREGVATSLDARGSGGGSVAADETGKGVPGAFETPGIGPRIIKMASVRLSVRRGEFQGAVDEARSIAAATGGFVVSSNQSQGEKRLMKGSLVLRVPERSYETVMRELGGVGRLDGRQENAQEVSAEFVDLQSRKRHLEAVERQLLVLLEDFLPAAVQAQVRAPPAQQAVQLPVIGLAFLPAGRDGRDRPVGGQRAHYLVEGRPPLRPEQRDVGRRFSFVHAA